MQQTEIRINIYNWHLWKRFWKITRLYWISENRWEAGSVLALFLMLMVADTVIAGKMSYITKDITDALEKSDLHGFNQSLLLMFCALAVATLVAVYKTYIQKKLNINWRLWLTTHFMEKYFSNRAYYRISSDSGMDNPDQRLSDNVRDYTDTSIGHISTIVQSLISFSIFSVILYGLSPKLLLIVLLYVGIGMLVTMVIGKRLVQLNFKAQQTNADFRHGMVHVRDNVESIAFFRGEEREKGEVSQRLKEYICNRLALIGWERNLECFTQVYKYLPMILPGLIMAPEYFSGALTLGDIMLGSSAFMNVLNALTGITDKFAAISSLVAVFTRVDAFAQAVDPTSDGQKTAQTSVITSREASGLMLNNVTLKTPDQLKTLIKNATAELSPGRGLLIIGASGTGKSSLLRAIAGLWNAGDGEIVRPPLEEMMFLPQRPYMIQGTLRDQLLYPSIDLTVSDDRLRELLEEVNLEELPGRYGGLDVVMEWSQLLSLGEQQRLSYARLLLAKPGYAILDEASSALDTANEAKLYRHLRESGMTYVSVGHRPSLFAYHDEVLELQGDGNWRLAPVAEISPGFCS